MDEINEATIAAIAGMSRAGMGPQSVEGGNIPYVLVPNGYTPKPMGELIYNEHAARPERIRQVIGVLDPASFVKYYTLFHDPNSRVFADETKLTVQAILDYHAAGEGAPRWGQHKLFLNLRQSEEWKVWAAANNKQVSQQQFAEFLEQNSMDVTRPSPADMMEIAEDLHATTEVAFGSGLRQQDGQIRFKYTEAVKATVGGGQVSVPDRFTIQIPAFVGGERVPMDALLRFRVKEGKLTFWFTLVRPEEVIRSAFIDARNKVASELGIDIINGAPAS